MIIGVDVDSVLADLDRVWLAWYNRDYNDNFTREQIKRWDFHLDLKPECGLKMYDYLKDYTLYDEVPVIEGALDGVLTLRNLGHRVVFITTTPIECSGRKYLWLKEHGFFNGSTYKNGGDFIDYIEASDKSLVRTDMLIDDNLHTIKAYPWMGVLFDQPWNQDLDWSYRVFGWKDFLEKFSMLEMFTDNA